MRDFRQAFRMMREVYKVANILVCDDDKDIVEAISIYLEQEGYTVIKAYDGVEAINVLRSQPVDLLIIDIMMPKLDGIRATLKIREENPLPIIILSAKSEDADKILGLNVGADDYVTKPFNPLELVARVKSQLRRYTRLGAAIPVENAHIYETGGLSINDDLKEVRVDGDVVKLTPIEYNILLLLMKNQGRVFSINQIYENIWNEEAVITDNNEDITSYKEYATVEESKASKFQYTDLTINSLKYMMTEAAVKNIYGTPVSEYESTEKDSNANAEYSEKVCSYNDLTLIFVKFTDDGRTAGKNENGTYKLTAAASVSDKDVFSRGLKVGMSVDSILSVYYRDQDYKNNYYTSDDSTAVLGKYLYGSFTLDELDKVNTKDAIAYGLINFNGYDSDETADNYIIEFTYFAPDYKNGTASVDDDFAQIAFDIDNNGVITAIRWYYYPQQ